MYYPNDQFRNVLLTNYLNFTITVQYSVVQYILVQNYQSLPTSDNAKEGGERLVSPTPGIDCSHIEDVNVEKINITINITMPDTIDEVAYFMVGRYFTLLAPYLPTTSDSATDYRLQTFVSVLPPSG